MPDTPDRRAGRFAPDAVARRNFGTSFRGFDQLEVKAFLAEVAEALREAADREADYRTRVETAEARTARAETVDESRLTEILGEETARVILAAKEAAAQIREKAEDSVARMLREAQSAAATIRGSAEAEAEMTRATTAAAAAAELEAARTEGRQMVAEAQAVRERVLDDLARRKKAARQQLEQLRAGRDRLLTAYGVVRATLDEATEELRVAVPEARAAAEAASPVEEEPEAAADEVVVVIVEPEPEPEPPAVVILEVVETVDDIADELPAAEFVPIVPSAPFEAVRLVVVPELGADAPPDSATDDSVGELFARLRAGQPDAEGDAEAAPESSADNDALDTEAVLARRDAVTDEVEHQLARRLKRVLADEQNEVLDRLRRVRPQSLADVLPPPEEQAARYAAGARADLRAAAAAGAMFFPGAKGTTSEVGDLAGELAGVIVGLVRDKIGRGFADAGDDPEELAERIRACYREWKTQRIGDTARHFVLAAFSRGLVDAQPDHVKLRWVVDDGGTPCPDAEDNALAGALERHEPFPTGHHYPPAHPGCRCLVVPEGQ
jgi:DivIVA domain-containing protein